MTFKQLLTSAATVIALIGGPAMADRGDGSGEGECSGCGGGNDGGNDSDNDPAQCWSNGTTVTYRGFTSPLGNRTEPDLDGQRTRTLRFDRNTTVEQARPTCNPEGITVTPTPVEPVAPVSPSVETPTPAPAPYVAPLPNRDTVIIVCDTTRQSAQERGQHLLNGEFGAIQSTGNDARVVRNIVELGDLPQNIQDELPAEVKACSAYGVIEINPVFDSTSPSEHTLVENDPVNVCAENGIAGWTEAINTFARGGECTFKSAATQPETCPAPEVAPVMTPVTPGILTPEFIAACVATPEVKVEILREALAADSSAPAQCPAP
jgi:hypothetical protein